MKLCETTPAVADTSAWGPVLCLCGHPMRAHVQQRHSGPHTRCKNCRCHHWARDTNTPALLWPQTEINLPPV